MEKYDLIVVGAGLSGVAASISAAREGLNVLLVEKSGVLGGAMSNAFIYPFMPYWMLDAETNEKKFLCGGIFREIFDRQQALYNEKTSEPNDALMNFAPEYIKLVLDEMICEAGVNILFHSTVYDVVTTGRSIRGIKVISGSEKLEFEADYFIDTSGDGNLFYMAGCDYELGRNRDNLCQPMTTCFRMSGVDIPLYYKENKKIQALYKKLQSTGEILNPREDILLFSGIGDGIMHFNTTRIVKLNPINPFDKSKAELEARKQILEIVGFLKENSEAFKNSTLVSIASEIGVRESRKLRGEHILTGDELKSCTKFDDGIALGNYDLDIHNPAGSGTSHYYFKPGQYYSIPYRSLLPKEYDNLLVAGRCLSATHEAQASVRIMPICTCTGEAAGCAAALAGKTGANAHTLDVKQLISNLKKNGAILEV